MLNKLMGNLGPMKDAMDNGDKEAIEELMQIAINKALEHAESVNEMEMASAARGMMPGMF
ncbi:MAG: hypothetical protein PF484_13410 [Bacteroidales bacterium]|jgi:DNA-binding protein YbaB|nr:hypothetical protein [Bacteroidales bacterium]